MATRERPSQLLKSSTTNGLVGFHTSSHMSPFSMNSGLSTFWPPVDFLPALKTISDRRHATWLVRT